MKQLKYYVVLACFVVAICGTVLADGNLFLTPLDIGCRNAKGLKDQDKIVDAIWANFAALQVKSAEDVTMTYWVDVQKYPWLVVDTSRLCHVMEAMINPSGPTVTAVPNGAPAGTTVKQVHDILTGVGTCTAWATLLNETFRAQGITEGKVSVIVSIPPPANSPLKPLGFYIKPGLAAQNNPHPPAITQNPYQVAPTIPPFGNHTVVSYTATTTILPGGGIFDPSYGKSYAKNTAAKNDPLLQWQKDSVDWLVFQNMKTGRKEYFPSSPGKLDVQFE